MFEDVPLQVRKLERIDIGPNEQPSQWTLLWFEAADEDADRLAQGLSVALEAQGGWYPVDFHSVVDDRVEAVVLLQAPGDDVDRIAITTLIKAAV